MQSVFNQETQSAHCHFHLVLPVAIRHHLPVKLLSVEGDALHAFVDTLRIEYMDFVVGTTELAANGVLLCGLWQAGVYEEAIVVGLDAKDEL